MAECTFQPKISKRSERIAKELERRGGDDGGVGSKGGKGGKGGKARGPTSARLARLAAPSQHRMAPKRELTTQEERDLAECTFRPTTNPVSAAIIARKGKAGGRDRGSVRGGGGGGYAAKENRFAQTSTSASSGAAYAAAAGSASHASTTSVASSATGGGRSKPKGFDAMVKRLEAGRREREERRLALENLGRVPAAEDLGRARRQKPFEFAHRANEDDGGPYGGAAGGHGGAHGGGAHGGGGSGGGGGGSGGGGGGGGSARRVRMFMDVNLGPGKTGRIAIHDGDSPRDLAHNFAAVYALSDDLAEVLEEMLREHIEALGIREGEEGTASSNRAWSPQRAHA
jgi:hypothetical protein